MNRRAVILGIALIYACTWPIDLALAAQSRGLLPFAVPPILGLFVGYGIVAGSLIATAIVSGRGGVRALLARFAIWRVGLGWYAVALVGVPVVYLAAIAVDVVLGAPAPDFGSPKVLNFMPAGLSLLVAIPGWFVYEIFTNGEEIGWRGFLLPRLVPRYGAFGATLIVATVWAFWHAPKFLVVPPVYDFPAWLWALDLLANAVVLTWLFLRTGGSLLLVTLFHASSNTAGMTLPVLPTSSGDTRLFTIAVLLLAASAIGVLLLDRTFHVLRRASAGSPLAPRGRTSP